MPLILAPALTDHTRKEIEAHLAEVRARRLTAAIHYHAGRNAKLSAQTDRINKRIALRYDQLGSAIIKLDQLDAKITQLLTEIGTLEQERDFTQEQMVFVNTEDAIAGGDDD